MDGDGVDQVKKAQAIHRNSLGKSVSMRMPIRDFLQNCHIGERFLASSLRIP
jgi:hypothetical protein